MPGDLWRVYAEIGKDRARQIDFIETHLKTLYQRANLPVNHSFDLRRVAQNIYSRLLPRPQENFDPYLYMPQEQLLEQVLRLDLYACYLATKLEHIYSDLSIAAGWRANNEHAVFYRDLMQRIATVANVRFDINIQFNTLPPRAALLQCFEEVHDQFVARVDLRDNQGRTILSSLWRTACAILLYSFDADRAVYPTLRQTLPLATMSDVDLRHELIQADFADYENIRNVGALFPIDNLVVLDREQPSFLRRCFNNVKDFCFAPSRFERGIGIAAGLSVAALSSFLGVGISLYAVAFAMLMPSGLMLYRNLIGLKTLNLINTRNLDTLSQVKQEAFYQGQEAARTWTAYAKTFNVFNRTPWAEYRSFSAGMQSELNEMERRQRLQ